MNEFHSVVLDNGSALTKAGTAGDETPLHNFPTEYNEKCPIKNGIITNWDVMEQLWEDTFENKLQIIPPDNSILVTEPPLSPKKNKEKTIEILLEKFKFPFAFVAPDFVLCHFASGRHAVLSVQVGHGVNSVVPIEGIYPVADAIIKTNTSGGDITSYLQEMLKSRDIEINFKTAQDIKETLCYINDKETQHYVEEEYILPDSKVIKLQNELHEAGEVLFNPLILDREAPGIHDMIYKSIMKCSIDLRKQFWNNIMLCGGTTNFNGFEKRLTKELEAKVPGTTKFKLIENENRQNLVWIGGSILASLSTFSEMCVSKTEFEEIGAPIVHKKCPNGVLV